ncbi:hypothetical protein D9619_004368 [Psilocybe cf. subviscida]|uniref:Uncharacterized protein n=1 Tax=Psilocybe cf. subviscida TaxID=2480587 RepID=A0A8H5BQT6_9AGAR|nr:hypothetical protein D9619_004368 [Psilocybe cf. subviscida]
MSSAEHNLQSKSGATPETQTTTRTQPTTQDNAPSTVPGTQTSTANSADAPAPPPPGEEDLPEQLHAGKVGYGPNYHRGPTLEDKMMGIKEEIKGKLTRNSERVEHGREIKSGKEREKKLTGEDEPNPFANADEDKDKDKDSEKPGDTTTKADEKLQLGNSNTTSSSTDNATGTDNATKTENTTRADDATGTDNAPRTGTGDLPSMKSTHKGHIRPDHGNAPDPRVQAAVVAPEGTHAAHRQKTEGGEGMMKHFGYDAPNSTENTGATKGLEPGQERERRSNPMVKN